MSKTIKVFPRKSTRPIDKEMRSIDVAITNVVQATVVRTAAVAETFNGGIMIGSFAVINAVANGRCIALLVFIREGDAPNVISLGDGAHTYHPETSILWARVWRWTGVGAGDPPPDSLHFVDTIKTKRKMHPADRIEFIVLGDVLNAGRFSGAFTSFAKQ